MIVNDILHVVKANRYTYYNLDSDSINEFQKYYRLLLKNKSKPINLITEKRIEQEIVKRELDYIKKMNVMRLILQNI